MEAAIITPSGESELGRKRRVLPTEVVRNGVASGMAPPGPEPRQDADSVDAGA
jgi:hypothetical protein